MFIHEQTGAGRFVEGGALFCVIAETMLHYCKVKAALAWFCTLKSNEDSLTLRPGMLSAWPAGQGVGGLQVSLFKGRSVGLLLMPVFWKACTAGLGPPLTAVLCHVCALPCHSARRGKEEGGDCLAVKSMVPWRHFNYLGTQ